MEKNRATLQKGKCGSAKHNEHEFMKDKKDVLVIDFVGDGTKPLAESELDFYNEVFGKSLQLQNEKHMKNRQYKRVKTIEEFHDSKRYRPTEEITQFGNVDSDPDSVPDKETYIKMISDLLVWKSEWSEAHGGHLVIINFSGHFDESTIHGQERSIWKYVDDDGITRIGQEEAMKRAGIELPHPDKKVGRFNNRNQTWTAMCRTKWQDICEQYGFNVERKPLPRKRKNETVKQYHDRKDREIQEREERTKAEEQRILEQAGQKAEQIEAEAQQKAEEIIEEAYRDRSKAFEDVREAELQEAVVKGRITALEASESDLEKNVKELTEKASEASKTVIAKNNTLKAMDAEMELKETALEHIDEELRERQTEKIMETIADGEFLNHVEQYGDGLVGYKKDPRGVRHKRTAKGVLNSMRGRKKQELKQQLEKQKQAEERRKEEQRKEKEQEENYKKLVNAAEASKIKEIIDEVEDGYQFGF